MVVDVENFYRHAFSYKLQERPTVLICRYQRVMRIRLLNDAKKKSSLFCSPKAEPLCRMFLQSKKL